MYIDAANCHELCIMRIMHTSQVGPHCNPNWGVAFYAYAKEVLQK